jgi:Vanadium chloroperoxidase N-terminal domain
MDAILFWNDIALTAVANDHTGSPAPLEQGGPTRTSRALAIIHVAMFDAFNSIDRSFTLHLQL